MSDKSSSMVNPIWYFFHHLFSVQWPVLHRTISSVHCSHSTWSNTGRDNMWFVSPQNWWKNILKVHSTVAPLCPLTLHVWGGPHPEKSQNPSKSDWKCARSAWKNVHIMFCMDGNHEKYKNIIQGHRNLNRRLVGDFGREYCRGTGMHQLADDLLIKTQLKSGQDLRTKRS